MRFQRELFLFLPAALQLSLDETPFNLERSVFLVALPGAVLTVVLEMAHRPKRAALAMKTPDPRHLAGDVFPARADDAVAEKVFPQTDLLAVGVAAFDGRLAVVVELLPGTVAGRLFSFVHASPQELSSFLAGESLPGSRLHSR